MPQFLNLNTTKPSTEDLFCMKYRVRSLDEGSNERSNIKFLACELAEVAIILEDELKICLVLGDFLDE